MQPPRDDDTQDGEIVVGGYLRVCGAYAPVRFDQAGELVLEVIGQSIVWCAGQVIDQIE